MAVDTAPPPPEKLMVGYLETFQEYIDIIPEA